IPSIFNISMVDVLCCALGCVMLLWLLNLREAKERAVSMGETTQKLESTQGQLLGVMAQRDEALKQAAQLAQERDRLQAELESARTALADLDRRLDALKTMQTEADDRLTKLARDQRSLSRERDEALGRITRLQAQLQEKETALKDATRR